MGRHAVGRKRVGKGSACRVVNESAYGRPNYGRPLPTKCLLSDHLPTKKGGRFRVGQGIFAIRVVYNAEMGDEVCRLHEDQLVMKCFLG